MRPDSPFSDNPIALYPAGAAHMSCPDWVRFGADQLSEGRRAGSLLKPDSYMRLHDPPDREAYAMGWGVGRSPLLGRTLSHAGSNTMWFAVAWLAPERDFAVLVTCNQGGDVAAKACDEAVGAVLQRHNTRKPAQVPAKP